MFLEFGNTLNQRKHKGMSFITTVNEVKKKNSKTIAMNSKQISVRGTLNYTSFQTTP